MASSCSFNATAYPIIQAAAAPAALQINFAQGALIFSSCFARLFARPSCGFIPVNESFAIPWPVGGSEECPLLYFHPSAFIHYPASVACEAALRAELPRPLGHLVRCTTSQVCLYSRPAARAPVVVAADSKKEQQHQEHVNSAFAPAVRSEDSKREQQHQESTLTARSRWTSRTRTTWST